ncbi:hypothetical protein [Sphingomonas flavalba]|uniref:hypothetical protein n=1 Tax=Sphingomonas flavalba TaxID=2559804 RepID=UPI00109DBED4|nr:hypothetical protein [Sphingomonas flavalba]
MGDTIAALRVGGQARAFDNATPFFRAFRHVAVAWLRRSQAALLLAFAVPPAPLRRRRQAGSSETRL